MTTFELKEDSEPEPGMVPQPPAREISHGRYASGQYGQGEYGQGQNAPEEPPQVIVEVQDSQQTGSQQTGSQQTITALRRMLVERDHALLRKALLASDLQHELEESKSATDSLQKQLKSAEKATEVARREASGKGTIPGDDEVAQMREQFRRAQRALERDFVRVRDELIRTKGEAHLTKQQLEIEARARRVEAAQASAKILALRQQVEEVAKANLTHDADQNSHKTKARVWVGSAAAVVMVIVGFWSQFSGLHGQTGKGAADPAVSSEVSATRFSGVSVAGNSSEPFVSQVSFQRSLSRLNNVLSGSLGRTPEQLLKEVRDSRPKAEPRVCDFAWNGGQPALRYGAASGGSLMASLNACATAVETYLANK